ncbi:MAG: hypothetical protein ACREF7_01810 [Candidatus Saccharimonadales bacterium]
MSLERQKSSIKPTPPVTEIERKFLVPELPDHIDLSLLVGSRIMQGYFANGSGHSSVMLQQSGFEYVQTVSQRKKASSVSRVEHEVQLSEGQFYTFWPATEGHRSELFQYGVPSEQDDHSSEHVLGRHILKGYLASSSIQNTVRLRKIDDRYVQTVKQPIASSVISNFEYETELTRDQFKGLWSATKGRRLKKVRYEIPYNERTIELDIFSGSLSGNMLAEVEFPSVEEAVLFQPPSWFGDDVSAERRYGNSCIAKHGFPELINAELES